MTIKINAQKVLKSLDGEILKDRACLHCGAPIGPQGGEYGPYHLGKAISDTLMRPNPQASMSAMKAFTLAKKFYNDKEVEVDAADLKDVKGEIGNDKMVTPLVSGQVLEHLESLKTEKEEEPAPAPAA